MHNHSTTPRTRRPKAVSAFSLALFAAAAPGFVCLPEASIASPPVRPGAPDGLPRSPDALHKSRLAGTVSIEGTVALQGSLNSAQQMTFEFRSTDGGSAFTRTYQLDAQGSFHLDNIPRDHYVLHVKGDKWLAVSQAVDASQTDVSGFAATLRGGDVNGDNACTDSDMSIMTAAFGSSPGNPRWDARADLNCDGQVNIDDLVLLAENYGAQGDP